MNDKLQHAKKKGDDLFNNIAKFLSNLEALVFSQGQFWSLDVLSGPLPFPAEELIQLWQYLDVQVAEIDGVRSEFVTYSENNNKPNLEPDLNAVIFGKLSESFQDWIEKIPPILLETDPQTFYKNMLNCSASLERLIHQLSEACVDKRVLTALRPVTTGADAQCLDQSLITLQSFWKNLEHFLRKWLYAVAQRKTLTAQDSSDYSFLLNHSVSMNAQQYSNAKLIIENVNKAQQPSPDFKGKNT